MTWPTVSRIVGTFIYELCTRTRVLHKMRLGVHELLPQNINATMITGYDDDDDDDDNKTVIHQILSGVWQHDVLVFYERMPNAFDRSGQFIFRLCRTIVNCFWLQPSEVDMLVGFTQYCKVHSWWSSFQNWECPMRRKIVMRRQTNTEKIANCGESIWRKWICIIKALRVIDVDWL